MFLKLVLVVLVTSHVGKSWNPSEPSMALNGCVEHCGDVSIPFPFGMAPGCYLEKSYKIDCQNLTSPVLSAGSYSLPVHEIMVESQTAHVEFPIIRRCGGSRNQTSSYGVSLKGSSFRFSTGNTLVGAGCDVSAKLWIGNLSIAGCMAVCNNESNCYGGPSCCEGVISHVRNLNIFNVTLEGDDDGHGHGGCLSAYLQYQSKIPYRGGEFSRKLNSKGYPTTALKWKLSYDLFYPILINRSLSVNRTVFCHKLDKNTTVVCTCENGFHGNPYKPDGCYVEMRPIDSRSKTSKVSRVIGGGFGGLLTSVGVWISYKIFKKIRARKLKEKFFKRNGGLVLQEKLSSDGDNPKKIRMFSPKELMRATDQYNVSRMLGKGGQGTVYKGMLEDGRIVAVKKSNALAKSKIRDFINEIVILSQVNHRNVVRLLGCCLETQVPMLVYEFIPNGNLFQLLHPDGPNCTNMPLTWDMRMNIAIEVSEAISYLHSAACIPVFHRDIKSTNILLDDKFQAKVADFGASKSVLIDQSHVTTRVQGTFGYMDPEYFRSSQFTDKSDVYSFGVVLVELVTGLKPLFTTEDDEIRNLAHYFVHSVEEDRLFDIVDENMANGAVENDEIIEVANLARRCLSWTGKDRPTMKEASIHLEGILNSRISAAKVSSLESLSSFDLQMAKSGGCLSFSTATTDQTGLTL